MATDEATRQLQYEKVATPSLVDLLGSLTSRPTGVTSLAATTQPVATHPATTKPATAQPVTTRPPTTQPVTTRPATTQPAATPQPKTTDPKPTEPKKTEQPATIHPNTPDPTSAPTPTVDTHELQTTTSPPNATEAAGSGAIADTGSRRAGNNFFEDASAISGSSDSSMSSGPVDAVARRQMNSKLNLGSMAGIIVGCLVCIALAFAFLHRRKKAKKLAKNTKKTHEDSVASTTASSTYFELPKGAKKAPRGSTGSAASAASAGSAKSTSSQSSNKTTSATRAQPSSNATRDKEASRTQNMATSGLVTSSGGSVGQKPPRSGHHTTRVPPSSDSAFHSATGFLSADPSRHANTEAPPPAMSASQSEISGDPTDSNRSIAGVMKSYRQQPPGMFDDKSARRTSVHTRRLVDDFEFTLDTGDRPVARSTTTTTGEMMAGAAGSPITDAPLLTRDSTKSLDDEDLTHVTHVTL